MDWPWETAAEYEALYRDDLCYHEHEMHGSQRASFWSRDAEYLRVAVARLTSYRALYPQAGTLLDVGAANGATVALAEAFGFEAVGYEPNGSMMVRARALGRNVRRGDCLSIEDGQWDLVTLHDVLEHLLNPVEALLALKRCVGEALIVEMPLLPDDAAEWATFRHRKPREHPFLYSEGAAVTLFAKAGLSVKRIEYPRSRGAFIGKAAYHLEVSP